jgi:dephospho-CoA kinase
MIRAGLTGGMACGKSFVAKIFESLGCHVMRADDVGREVMVRGAEAFEPILSAFGALVLNEAGEIDRKRLAAEVFASPDRLAQLNAIVHPAVIRREEDFLRQWELADPSGVAIVEAAILIETGSYRRFDKLIVVVCTPEQQVERAVKRDGCTPEQARARLSRQLPVEEKRRYADYVIDTSGAKERTVEQTTAVYQSLRSLNK